MTNPNQIRAQTRQKRSMIPTERREAMQRRACERVAALGGFLRARVVMAYCAVGGEIDPSGIVLKARELGKRVCFPVVRGDEILAVEPLNEGAWRRGAFGIYEPDLEGLGAGLVRVISSGDIDCALVPGVVFDEFCNRMGQGRGYYDRFLANAGIYCVGLAFECQVVERLDVLPHDVRMDAVATDERLIMH